MFKVDENYSIQAKNLLDNLVDEYKNLIKDIHKIDILLKQIKSIRVEVNSRTRWISEVANITKEVANKKVKILIYNDDYLSAIEDEVKQLKLNFEINGQFIEVFQPDFSYNDLMTLVDEIEKKKIKLFQNAVKLKWIQLSDLSMQSKMNLLILRLQEKLQIIAKKCSRKMRKS